MNSFLSKYRILVLVAFLSGNAFSAEGRQEPSSSNKRVTVIAAESNADGSSEVRKELLEQCISSLPAPESLEAETKAETRFLREINGEPGRNAHTRIFTAKVELNYLLYQKELIIVTTRSVEGQPPVLKETESRLRQSETFNSDAGSGDLFAGRSNRQYYFSTPEAAAQDAKARAATWIRQQSGALCPVR